MKINMADTRSAKVKFTKGTIKFETHHGTLDLSTTELITLQPPSKNQDHEQ